MLVVHHSPRSIRNEPRLRVECALQHTAKCAQSQSIACSEEWRLLQPIRRTDDLFHALQHSNRNKESLFHHWRRRYAVAGNDFAERPKRRQSVPCQMLRASAGLLVEWLRICLRHGWVSGPTIVNDTEPVERDSGELACRRIWRERHDLDLDLPYGRAAVRAGYARSPLSPAERLRSAIAQMTPEALANPLNLPPVGTDMDALPF